MNDKFRKRAKISRQLQVEVLFRDFWLCRLCGRPVIFAPAMKMLQRELKVAGYPDLAYWSLRYDRKGAPLLDYSAAVIDHVKSFSKGGSGLIDNLATACNKCNDKKSNSEPKLYSERNPAKKIKSRYGEPTAWDGLSSIFILFGEKHLSDLTTTERQWLRILKARSTRAKVDLAVGRA